MQSFQYLLYFFGLLALVLNKALEIGSVEAISGLIGIVVTFYFTTRGNAETQKIVGAAQEVAASAKSIATSADTAAQGATKAADGANAAATAVKSAGQPGASPNNPAPGAQVTADQSSLREIRDKVEDARQIFAAIAALNSGSEVLDGADKLAAQAVGLLSMIEPLLTGAPDPVKIAEVTDQASRTLADLDSAGLPGIFGDVIAAMGSIGGVAAPIISGAAGGPAGLVAGVVLGGVKLLQDHEKFVAWQAALLNQPFSRDLLPQAVDGTAAVLALQMSPLMSTRLSPGPNPDMKTATDLMRALLECDANGVPLAAADLAAKLLTPGNAPDLSGKFASAQELSEAIEEYRGSVVFGRASARFAGTVDIPALEDEPARSPKLEELAKTVLAATRADPRMAADIDRLVFLTEALGKVQFSPDRLTAVVTAALAAGAKLAKTGRETADQRQVSP